MDHLQNTFFSNNTHQIIIKSQDNIWPSVAGAFFGAFFAFIFGLIAFYLQKKFERYWKHKNSIVELEHILQDHLDQNAANQFLLEGAIATLKHHNMTYTLLIPLRFPDDIDLRFGDVELLNRYLDYREPAVKVNHGMSAWQGVNELLHQNVITNPQLPAQIVHGNMAIIENQGEGLLKFMVGLDEDTKYLLAYVTIYIRKDKHIWSKWITSKRNKKVFITEQEIAKEAKNLEKAIAENIKKSRERIAKITNSATP